MIESTIDTIDGVHFLKDIKFVDPYEYENGVHIEKVSRRLLDKAPETEGILKVMGMREVGIDYCLDAVIYARYPMGYFVYKATHHLLRGYWWLIRFLYNNARMFRQIPEAECFSWKYFTPYVWFKKWRANGRKLSNRIQ